MIKALILLTLLAFTFAEEQHFEVIVFRGQLPLITAQMNFKEINHQGIVLKNYKKSEVSEADENAWKTVVFESGDLNAVLPLRRTGSWRKKVTKHLGVLLQSIYRCDNGDEFQITLAFGLCNNSYDTEIFTGLLDILEAKRQANSEELRQLFSRVKKESDTCITSRNTLDDLTDDHVDNSKRMNDLKELNTKLIAELKKLNADIHEKEETEFTKEKECAEACSSARISEAAVKSYSHESTCYEQQVTVLEAQLNSSAAFTDEERERYAGARRELLDSINELAAFNKKVDPLHVVEGKQLDPEDLRPYFYSK